MRAAVCPTSPPISVNGYLTVLARLSSAILFILLAGPLAALTPVWDTYAPADSFLRGLAAQANAEPYPWTLNGDRIYVLQSRSLVALSASTGSLLWQREVGKSATLALLTDGGVAVASDGQYPASVGVVQLRRYSPSGNILWQRAVTTRGAIPALIPTPIPASAITVASHAEVVSIDFDGNERWRRPSERSGQVCVAGATGALGCTYGDQTYVLNATTGKATECELDIIYEFTAARLISPNTDGSFTCYSTAQGTAAYRYAADGSLVARLTPDSPRSRWYPRRDGGMIAYEPLSISILRVVSRAPSGAVEWERNDVPGYGRDPIKAAIAGAVLLTQDSLTFTWATPAAIGQISNVTGAEGRAPVFVTPDLVVVGSRLVALSLPASGIIWRRPDVVLIDNVNSFACQASFRPEALAIDAPRVAQIYGSPPALDSFSLATGAVSTYTMPPGDAIRDFMPPQRSVARDTAGHFYSIWITGEPGAYWWRLREYDATGSLLRASDALPLPAPYSIDSREVTVAPGGELYARIDGTVTRFDANLNVLWTYQRPDAYYFSTCPGEIVATDGAGVVVSFPDRTTPTLTKLAHDGTLLWQRALTGPAKLVTVGAGGHIGYAVTNSSRDLVSVIASDGSLIWEQPSGGSTVQRTINQVAFRPDGGLLVVGQHDSYPNGTAFVENYNALGQQTFSVTPVVGNDVATAAKAVLLRPDGSALVAVGRYSWTDEVNGFAKRWSHATMSFSATGAVRGIWVDADRQNRRTAAGWTTMVADPSGDVIQAGRFAPPDGYYITANVRRVRLEPTDLQLFASIGGSTVEAGAPLPVTVSLRDAQGATAVAPYDMDIWATLAAELSTTMFPRKVCTITAGTSACFSQAIRPDFIGTLPLMISGDGVRPFVLPSITVGPATMVMSMRYIDPPPYRAGTSITVEYQIRPSYLPEGQTLQLSRIDGQPSSRVNLAIAPCDLLSPGNQFPVVLRCRGVLPGAESAQLTFSWESNLSYAMTTLTTTVAPIARSSASIVLESIWPTGVVPVGTFVAPVVSVRVAGQSEPQKLTAGSLVFTLGNVFCVATPVLWAAASMSPQETNYYTCDLRVIAAGPLTLSIAFAGSTQLEPATITAATVVNAAPLSALLLTHRTPSSSVDQNYLPTSVCSVDDSVRCEPSPDGTRSLCLVPDRWQGTLQTRPANPRQSFIHTSPPMAFGPVEGLVGPITVNDIQLGSCRLDLDRDGYITADRDGVLMLRAMLGTSGAALTADAVNRCSSRTDPVDIASVAQQSIASGAVNFNGAGTATITANGLIFLRYALGLRGEALLMGATSAPVNAQSAQAVLNLVANVCQ